jgi:cohesin loading factor subunit SCC2
MHQKHETTIEKEYVRSIQRSLAYQQAVVGDPSGFTGSPPKPKLHYFWDVLKAGKVKVRHKFLGNIVLKLEFEPTSLDIRTNNPPELALARYVCENLAFFEYERLDDLLKVLSALEKSFASLGTPVAQSIESEVLQLNVAAMLAPDPMAIGTITGESTNTINPARLKTLALSAQILLVISETRAYILRLFNLQKVARNTKGAAKENSKAPTRATNAPALTDNYIRSVAGHMTPAGTSEQQHILCQQFIDVMTVDSEAKLPSDDEDDVAIGGGGDVSGSEGRSATPPAGNKGRKRKSASASQSTPRKKGRPRKSSVSKATDDGDDGGWD